MCGHNEWGLEILLNFLLIYVGRCCANFFTVSVILKYLKFEVVIYEILDFEGHKYEELDYFS